MHVLIVLTYYQPYKSGLTLYAVRQARALAARGHNVTVLTSRYHRELLAEEFVDGVRIVRAPVAFRLSKGVVMPALPFIAWKLIGQADVVNLHVPQADAAMLAFLAKLRRRPVVMTYHCDIRMPEGWAHKLAGWAIRLAHRISANLADVIVHNTRDFAEHSAFLKRYMHKLVIIQPPVIVEPVTVREINAFRQKYSIQANQRVVGMLARLAAEKGVEYLVEAVPEVVRAVPDARIIFAGQYKDVLGESAYRDRLLPMIRELGERWTFLGVVSEEEKSAFFKVCDVLVLPSINSTESFGMVQIEAMSCGTPVIATDLPGVRRPVLSSGMGKIVPPRDSTALSEAIIDLLKKGVRNNPEQVRVMIDRYAPETVAQAYETLFQGLKRRDG
jgi:glycosyltransferase involved in cell wall biosynthesis